METVMSTSVAIEETRVTFPNQLTSMAGILFTRPGMDKTKKYPALAVAHPFGGVKEQTSGNYARKMPSLPRKLRIALRFANSSGLRTMRRSPRRLAAKFSSS